MSMKTIKRILPMLLSLVMLLSLGALTASGAEPTAERERTGSKKLRDLSVEQNAILYAIDSGTLLYNVTHAAPLDADAAVIDRSENGINTIQKLKKTLGTPDAPHTRFSTEPGVRTLGDAVRANLGFNAEGVIVSVQIVSVQPRPIVGISWRRDEISEEYRRCAEILEKNGACTVYLPQILTAEDADRVLRAVDGIFVTGGEGWNPSRYGQAQTPHGSANYNERRDVSDLFLIRQAISLDVPMLAVCRGAQGMNVALGGELIQDIPYYLGQKVAFGEIEASRVSTIISGRIPETVPGYDELPARLKRSVQDKGYKIVSSSGSLICLTYDEEHDVYNSVNGQACKEGHLRVRIDGLDHGSGYHPLQSGDGNENVAISESSRWLYELFGTTTLEHVYSAHHQAIDPEHLGAGLTVAARSSDGIVEAVEYPGATFAVGLQWHPEKDALGDSRGTDVDQDVCNAPLAALVRYAGSAAAQRLVPQPTASHDESGKPALSWQAVTGAAKYQVFRSENGADGDYTRLKTVTEPRHVNVKAEAGRAYWYKVRSITETGVRSAFSEVIRITAKPEAPQIKGELNGEGKPSLSWKAVSGAQKYQIFRSETGLEGSYQWLANTVRTEFVYTRAEAGKSFWYKVRAVTEDATKSGYSEAVRLTTAPAAPEVTGSLSEEGKPALRWESVEGAEKYQVYRSTTGEEGSFTRLKTVTELSHVNLNAKAGKTYWYQVRAVNGEGQLGPFSESVKLTAIKAPKIKPTPTPQRSYQIFREDVSWQEAARRCEEKGGHLAVVRNAEELQKITALAEESGALYLWLGCRRVDGELRWVTGESVDTYFWGKNEPSLQDSFDGEAEDYLLLWKLNGEWAYNDSREDPVKAFPYVYHGRIAYVCEFEDAAP